MLKFKGFASIRSLISNTDKTVSPIGELSSNAMTYAKDVKIYGGSMPGVQIHAFSCKRAGVDATASDSVVVSAVSVVEWVIRRQSAITQTDTATDFRLALSSEFPQLSSFYIGELVQASDGKLYPTFVSWKITDLGEDNETTIYLSNTTFETEYDDYIIDEIPPLNAIDGFFEPYANAVQTLASLNYISMLQRIQDRRALYPETILTAETYNFYNSNDSSVKTETPWTFLIYGQRGNDPDAIKQALISYIASNSTRSEAQWRTIFPDIFKTTEFVFVPLWENMSVSEMTSTQGVYSPILRLGDDLTSVRNKLGLTNSQNINDVTCILPRPYKSIICVCVGSEENKPTQKKISDVFPDIINVSSTSLDFGRMSQRTQEFILLLDDLIYRAETYTGKTTLPSGYRVANRNGKNFIFSTHYGIKYAVMTRESAIS